MSRTLAAGNLYSTLDDLAQWVRAFQSETLLDHESMTRMLTPNAVGFGYGWEIIPDLEGAPAILHNGAIEGFLSNVTLFPTLDVTVVIFTNVVTIGENVERPNLSSIRMSVYQIIVRTLGR
jgi:CubicO group peptidase (beta-lactamase class C family)